VPPSKLRGEGAGPVLHPGVAGELAVLCCAVLRALHRLLCQVVLDALRLRWVVTCRCGRSHASAITWESLVCQVQACWPTLAPVFPACALVCSPCHACGNTACPCPAPPRLSPAGAGRPANTCPARPCPTPARAPPLQDDTADSFAAFADALNITFDSEADFLRRVGIFEDTLFEISEINAVAETYYVSRELALSCRAGGAEGCGTSCSRRPCSLPIHVLSAWPPSSQPSFVPFWLCWASPPSHGPAPARQARSQAGTHLTAAFATPT